MKKKKEVQDELNELSPFLSEMKKEDGFRVPFNYFEQLPDEVMRKIREEAAPAPAQAATSGWLDQAINSLAALFQPRYALALASIAIVITAGVFMMRSMDSQTTVELAETTSISDEEIQNYIAANIDDFDAGLLYEADVAEVEQEATELDSEDAELDKYIDQIIDEIDTEDLEQLL